MGIEISDVLKLGLNEHFGSGEYLEIFWGKPLMNSPDLVIQRWVHKSTSEIPRNNPYLDQSQGERGGLLGYYVRTVRENKDKGDETEKPYIEVSMTKERNGVPHNNLVRIPLSYVRQVYLLDIKVSPPKDICPAVRGKRKK